LLTKNSPIIGTRINTISPDPEQIKSVTEPTVVYHDQTIANLIGNYKISINIVDQNGITFAAEQDIKVDQDLLLEIITDEEYSTDQKIIKFGCDHVSSIAEITSYKWKLESLSLAGISDTIDVPETASVPITEIKIPDLILQSKPAKNIDNDTITIDSITKRRWILNNTLTGNYKISCTCYKNNTTNDDDIIGEDSKTFKIFEIPKIEEEVIIETPSAEIEFTKGTQLEQRYLGVNGKTKFFFKAITDSINSCTYNWTVFRQQKIYGKILNNGDTWYIINQSKTAIENHIFKQAETSPNNSDKIFTYKTNIFSATLNPKVFSLNLDSTNHNQKVYFNIYNNLFEINTTAPKNALPVFQYNDTETPATSSWQFYTDGKIGTDITFANNLSKTYTGSGSYTIKITAGASANQYNITICSNQKIYFDTADSLFKITTATIGSSNKKVFQYYYNTADPDKSSWQFYPDGTTAENISFNQILKRIYTNSNNNYFIQTTVKKNNFSLVSVKLSPPDSSDRILFSKNLDTNDADQKIYFDINNNQFKITTEEVKANKLFQYNNHENSWQFYSDAINAENISFDSALKKVYTSPTNNNYIIYINAKAADNTSAIKIYKDWDIEFDSTIQSITCNKQNLDDKEFTFDETNNKTFEIKTANNSEFNCRFQKVVKLHKKIKPKTTLCVTEDAQQFKLISSNKIPFYSSSGLDFSINNIKPIFTVSEESGKKNITFSDDNNWLIKLDGNDINRIKLDEGKYVRADNTEHIIGDKFRLPINIFISYTGESQIAFQLQLERFRNQDGSYYYYFDIIENQVIFSNLKIHAPASSNTNIFDFDTTKGLQNPYQSIDLINFPDKHLYDVQLKITDSFTNKSSDVIMKPFIVWGAPVARMEKLPIVSAGAVVTFDARASQGKYNLSGYLPWYQWIIRRNIIEIRKGTAAAAETVSLDNQQELYLFILPDKTIQFYSQNYNSDSDDLTVTSVFYTEISDKNDKIHTSGKWFFDKIENLTDETEISDKNDKIHTNEEWFFNVKDSKTIDLTSSIYQKHRIIFKDTDYYQEKKVRQDIIPFQYTVEFIRDKVNYDTDVKIISNQTIELKTDSFYEVVKKDNNILTLSDNWTFSSVEEDVVSKLFDEKLDLLYESDIKLSEIHLVVDSNTTPYSFSIQNTSPEEEKNEILYFTDAGLTLKTKNLWTLYHPNGNTFTGSKDLNTSVNHGIYAAIENSSPNRQFILNITRDNNVTHIQIYNNYAGKSLCYNNGEFSIQTSTANQIFTYDSSGIKFIANTPWECKDKNGDPIATSSNPITPKLFEKQVIDISDGTDKFVLMISLTHILVLSRNKLDLNNKYVIQDNQLNYADQINQLTYQIKKGSNEFLFFLTLYDSSLRAEFYEREIKVRFSEDVFTLPNCPVYSTSLPAGKYKAFLRVNDDLGYYSAEKTQEFIILDTPKADFNIEGVFVTDLKEDDEDL